MARSYQRYDKQQLELLVKESQSFTEVCRKLNKKPVGGTITNLKLMCTRQGIDFSHMTGQAWKRGRVDTRRTPPEKRLVMGKPSDHRVGADRLRRSMFEVGFKHICNNCGIDSWNGKPLVLEIDHIDEQYWNNTKENLQFLCPNCHAQKTKNAQVTQLV